MMRPAARRARQFADTKGQLPDPRELWLNGVPETSSKGFLSRVDKYGEPYYVPHKRRALAVPDPDVQRDFFQVSDLLLDLDADGARTVRPYVGADERRLVRQWAVTPERAAVRATVDRFKEQIHVSRLGAIKALLRPISASVVSPHDIFSAALLGAPASSGSTPCARSESAGPPQSARARALEAVCLDNGVPRHALYDDEQLLRWLLLRRNALQASRKEQKPAQPTPAHLSNALRHQSTLAGIRRVVFQAIAEGIFVGSFAEERALRTSLTSRVRKACDSVLSQTPTRRIAVLETLAFIGNLSERISRPDRSVGTPLCALALRLSAELGDVAATAQWVQHGYKYQAWAERKMAADFQLALASFPPLLSGRGEHRQLQQAQDRQHLFRVLAGVDEKGQASAGSLRHAVMHCLSNACKAAHRTKLALYESYLVLLARLGAARLLWTEWRFSAPLARKLYDSQGGIIETVAAIFRRALCQLVFSVAASDRRAPQYLSMEECARLDHIAVAAQDPGSWRGGSTLDVGVGEATPLLDSPLDAWLEAVNKLRRDSRAET